MVDKISPVSFSGKKKNIIIAIFDNGIGCGVFRVPHG